MAYEFLKKHAIDNVWCNFEQDNQSILKAARITKPDGIIGQFKIMGDYLTTPQPGKYYQIYQVGQVHPRWLGLLSRIPHWTVARWWTFKEAVNKLPLFADLYTDLGIHIPLFNSYYMFTNSKALIIAVQDIGPDNVYLKEEAIYLRLYTNEHYSHINNGLTPPQMTFTDGLIVSNLSDINSIRSAIAIQKSKPGVTYCFVNGLMVENVTLLNTKIGDIVEYIYDSSIRLVHDLQVGTLKSFLSTLDTEYKYVLHRPKADDLGEIEYIDDIDVYIVWRTELDREFAVYFHRNAPDALRMLTHRDYSANTNHFDNLSTHLAGIISPTPLDSDRFYFRIYSRESGLKRPLVFENQRIFELYKLTDEQILGAIIGLDATVPVWQADNLESCAYTEMMRTDYRKATTIDFIQKAYGYNGMTKYLADMPLKADGNHPPTLNIFHLPHALQKASTIFEYDQDGVLLEWHNHTDNWDYIAVNPETKMIDGIVGISNKQPSVYYGKTDIDLGPDYHTRKFWRCDENGGVPDNRWERLTDDTLFHIEDDKFIWDGAATSQWIMARTDEVNLCYDLNLETIAGTTYFPLTEWYNGDEYLLRFPFADITLWLNGRLLIKDLDYIIRFPEIYIINKEYLMQPANIYRQKVTVLCTGFCTDDNDWNMKRDIGYVEHGVLSNNYRFNLRDDKVLRMSIEGCLKHRDDLIFSELHAGISVVNPTNGQPYQIQEVLVPLRFYAEGDTYEEKAKSVIIDKDVEDYMTLKIPQPDRPAVSAIPNRYKLVSPFFSHIINDLAVDMIDRTQVDRVLTDEDVLAICQPYEYLLEYDPINNVNDLNTAYVVIHPHNLEETIYLNLPAYRFVQQMVKLYSNGLIRLSPHLEIGF
jgi:hypothetical protein